jgi:hypothetical protein
MDPTKDFVKRWMEERGYEFPVLWSGSYHRKAKVRGYPTTWVVDREGNIAFEVLGGTDRFEQEYGWRVEAVLEEG